MRAARPVNVKTLYKGVADGLLQIPGHLINSVEKAPEQEGKARSVPEPRHRKNNQNVEVFSPCAPPVSAKRNIKIIPEPGGQRNMPVPPEFRNRRRQIRRSKILHHPETQDPCRADGDRRIPGKITVNLNGIEQNRKHHKGSRNALRIGIHPIHHNRNPVRQNHLQKIAPRHNQKAVSQIVKGKIAGLFKLRQHIPPPLNRAGQNPRKKRNKQRIGKKTRPVCSGFFPSIPHRRILPGGCLCGSLRSPSFPPAVHHIAKRLQRVERNSNRKKSLLKDSREKHAPVLAEKQDAEIGGNAQKQRCPDTPPPDISSRKIRGPRCKNQKQQAHRVPRRIEQPAEGKQYRRPRPLRAKIAHQRRRKQKGKIFQGQKRDSRSDHTAYYIH